MILKIGSLFGLNQMYLGTETKMNFRTKMASFLNGTDQRYSNVEVKLRLVHGLSSISKRTSKKTQSSRPLLSPDQQTECEKPDL